MTPSRFCQMPMMTASAGWSFYVEAVVDAGEVAAEGGAVAVVVAVGGCTAWVNGAGAALVVKTAEGSARGTVLALERVSDGAQASIELSGRVASELAIGVGAVVTVSVIATGVVLSAAGEALAFVPNEAGRALLHNEQVTR